MYEGRGEGREKGRNEEQSYVLAHCSGCEGSLVFHTVSTPFVLRPVSSWEEGEEDKENFSSAILQYTCTSFEPTLSVLDFKLQDKIRNGKSGFIAIYLQYEKPASKVLDKLEATWLQLSTVYMQSAALY